MSWEIPFSGYVVRAPNRRTAGRMEGRTDGYGQNYIAPPSVFGKEKKHDSDTDFGLNRVNEKRR